MTKSRLNFRNVAMIACLAVVSMFLGCDKDKKTVEYTVKFNADGGVPAPADQKVKESETVKEPPVMTKTDHTFDGWYRDTEKWNFVTDKVTADMTLNAKWTQNNYASEVQKEAIVAALSEYGELSEFAAAFLDMNFANIQSDAFTVFAVKNGGMTKPALKSTADNGISMWRQIVKGKHAKSSLKNEQKLSALDKTILMVNVSTENGLAVYVNGVELGEEITAGKSVVYIVEEAIPETVSNISVTGIKLNIEAVALQVGKTVKLIATVLPSFATNKNVIWSSSDNDVATVDDTGTVTAVTGGMATVTIETEDGGLKASCVVTVAPLKQMFITTLAAKITLKIAGTDKMTIDWGDGTVETHTLATSMFDYSNSGWYTKPAFAHNYSSASQHNITITGENIIDLSCGADPIGCVPYNNIITSLNVSKNKALLYLDCTNNQLTELDVSNNTLLRGLFCFDNQLTTLDINNCILLEDLQCENNQLTGLDVSNNTVLTQLRCYYNPITSLNVSKNKALKFLWFEGDLLMSLDVSNNTALESLWFAGKLTSLDLSKNKALTQLKIYAPLTSLNLSNNTALTWLEVGYTLLTNLDVSKNTALKFLWYSENYSLTSLDVSKNVLLETLQGGCQFGNSQLTSIDVSKNTALKSLDLNENQITDLDVSKNKALTSLGIAAPLKSLNLDNNTALTLLTVGNCLLTSLDVSKNTVLQILRFFNTQITDLDVSKNTVLKELGVVNNQFTAEKLNVLFGTLHNNAISGKSVTIGGNPGTDDCNRSIATSKGWIVQNYWWD